MKIQPTKYFHAHVFAIMGVILALNSTMILTAIFAGFLIGVGLKMAYDAGKETNS